MPFHLEERFIEAAEEKLGTTLPLCYRSAMGKSNGGTVAFDGDAWDLYPIADDSSRKRLARSLNCIVLETECLRRWRGFPKDAVAFASNEAGDQLLFLALDSQQLDPAVYVWRHETAEVLRAAEDFADLRIDEVT